jgi:hypothetical protein
MSSSTPYQQYASQIGSGNPNLAVQNGLVRVENERRETGYAAFTTRRCRSSTAIMKPTRSSTASASSEK